MSLDFMIGMAAGLVGAYVIQAAAYIVADWYVSKTEGSAE